MNSDLLSALEGAEQLPSQGFARSYPDYSQNIQNVPSSENCDDTVEIVETPSYTLHIQGNPSISNSSEPQQNTIHQQETQNFNHSSCNRLPKKLTPPVRYQQVRAVSQSPSTSAAGPQQQRQNGYTLLNTQSSPLQPGSKIVILTPTQQMVSQTGVLRNALQQTFQQQQQQQQHQQQHQQQQTASAQNNVHPPARQQQQQQSQLKQQLTQQLQQQQQQQRTYQRPAVLHNNSQQNIARHHQQSYQQPTVLQQQSPANSNQQVVQQQQTYQQQQSSNTVPPNSNMQTLYQQTYRQSTIAQNNVPETATTYRQSTIAQNNAPETSTTYRQSTIAQNNAPETAARLQPYQASSATDAFQQQHQQQQATVVQNNTTTQAAPVRQQQQTFEPYVPLAMQQTVNKAVPVSTAKPTRGTGRGRGRGQSTRGRGRGRGRGRSLRGNATGVVLNQSGITRYTSPTAQKTQLVLDKPGNTTLTYIQKAQQINQQVNRQQSQQTQHGGSGAAQQARVQQIIQRVQQQQQQQSAASQQQVVSSTKLVDQIQQIQQQMAAGGRGSYAQQVHQVSSQLNNVQPQPQQQRQQQQQRQAEQANPQQVQQQIPQQQQVGGTHVQQQQQLHVQQGQHQVIPQQQQQQQQQRIQVLHNTEANQPVINLIYVDENNQQIGTPTTMVLNSKTTGIVGTRTTQLPMASVGNVANSSPIANRVPVSNVEVISSDSDSNSPTNNNPCVTKRYHVQQMPTLDVSPSSSPVPVSAQATTQGISTTLPSLTMTPSHNLTPGQTVTLSKNVTPSQTMTLSQTMTPSQTMTLSQTVTPSQTMTPSQTASASPTITLSQTMTPSQAATGKTSKPAAKKGNTRRVTKKAVTKMVPMSEVSNPSVQALLLQLSKSSPQMKQMRLPVCKALAQTSQKLSQSLSSQSSLLPSSSSLPQSSASQTLSTSSTQSPAVQSTVAHPQAQSTALSSTTTTSQKQVPSQSSTVSAAVALAQSMQRSHKTAQVSQPGQLTAVQQKTQEEPEAAARPPSPEIPPELADKEGLCKNCGQWSSNLKKCDSCGKNIFKMKGIKYKTKEEGAAVILYASQKPNVEPRKAEAEPVNAVNKKGIQTNKFYNNIMETHIEPYQNIVMKVNHRGGGRGKRGRGRGRGGRAPNKYKEPELISISSDSEEDDAASHTSVPSSETNTPMSTPGRNNNTLSASESQLSNESNIDSSSDNMEMCMTPPVKRKAKMRDEDGNTPVKEASLTVTAEPALQHKKVAKNNVISIDEVIAKEEAAAVPLGVKVPVVESMDVCLIRFGSWTPSTQNPVVFQSNGVLFNFSAMIDHCAQLRLDAKDITLCQYSLRKGMPTVFLYTTPKFGMLVRERLRLTKGGPYFDPCSSDESEKRVIIRPMRDPDPTQATRISKAFDGIAACTNRIKSALFTELDKEAVNRLLVSSKPVELPKKNVHPTPSASNSGASSLQQNNTIVIHSSQQKKSIVTVSPSTYKIASIQLASLTGGAATVDGQGGNAEEDKEIIIRRILGPCVTLFIYPPPPSTGGITVTSDDKACLDEGEFLNDVIIDFYLKYIMQEKLSTEDKNRTYIFSSFFYKRLTQREYGRHVTNPELSTIEKRHNRVKKWTRNVDLFDKDFIVIPINESAHWYVAVICFPSSVVLPEWQMKSTKYSGGESSDLSESPSPSPSPPPPSPPPPNICSSEAEAATPVSSETGVAVEDPPDLDLQVRNSRGSSMEKSDSSQIGNDVEEPMDIDDNVSESQPMDTQESATSAMEEDNAIISTTQDSTPGALDNNIATMSDANQCTSTSGPQEDQESSAIQLNSAGEGSQEGNSATQAGVSSAAASSSSNGPTKTFQPKRTKQPCILVFDSLRGPCRRNVIQKLREYLAIEWQTRKKSNCVFDGHTMRGQSPEVPQQTNFSDCGVFVLQYVESFFENPISRVSLPLRGLSQWFTEETANGKREEIKNVITALEQSWKSGKDR